MFAESSVGLNLNHLLFRIWQYLCHSILLQNSPLNVMNRYTNFDRREGITLPHVRKYIAKYCQNGFFIDEKGRECVRSAP